MKRHFLVLVSLLILASLLGTSTAADTGSKTFNSSFTAVKSPAIVKDEIFVPMENGTLKEWRHIVLKGNNTQIGMALAEISQNDYGVMTLVRYADPIYGKARQEYMARNYPIMLERMRGVAAAYGISPDNGTFDTSMLPYDAGSLACSAVYFPPSTTDNAHAIESRDMEWYFAPADAVFLHSPLNTSGRNMMSRIYVLEIYPDKGYATIVVGGQDLMGTVHDGLNSEGLGISALQDEGLDPVSKVRLAGDRTSGLGTWPMARLVLDTCKNVEEAKVTFLVNKEYIPLAGIHYLVYDSSGNSTIVEWNKTDGNLYFTDGKVSQPDIMTNHPMFKYSKYKLENLPHEIQDPYDTFNRYRVLYNLTSSHQGKFSEEDIANELSAVYGNGVFQLEGAVRPLQLNTLYNVILDLTDRSLKVKCFLNYGPVDPKTNKSALNFSPYFTFKMNSSSVQK